MFNQIDFVSSAFFPPALTLTAAIFPHMMQSALKLYVRVLLSFSFFSLAPMEFVHGEESLRAGGGETFCTFLSDTFTSPPAEPAAAHADSGCSHASAHLNRHRVSRARTWLLLYTSRLQTSRL